MPLFSKSPSASPKREKKENKKDLSTETTTLISASEAMRKYNKMESSEELSKEEFVKIVFAIKHEILERTGKKPDKHLKYSEAFFTVAAELDVPELLKSLTDANITTASSDLTKLDKLIAPTILFIAACYRFSDKYVDLIVNPIKNLPDFKEKDQQFFLASQWLKIKGWDSNQIAQIEQSFLYLAEIYMFYFCKSHQKYFEKNYSGTDLTIFITNFDFQKLRLNPKEDISDITALYKSLGIDEVNVVSLREDQTFMNLDRLAL